MGKDFNLRYALSKFDSYYNFKECSVEISGEDLELLRASKHFWKFKDGKEESVTLEMISDVYNFCLNVKKCFMRNLVKKGLEVNGLISEEAIFKK